MHDHIPSLTHLLEDPPFYLSHKKDASSLLDRIPEVPIIWDEISQLRFISTL